MDRGQFTFYASFARAAERIKKKEDRCDFYDVIKDYALYGQEPDFDALPDSVAVAFELVRPNLDASKRKAEAGKRGGTTKQEESNEQANASKAKATAKQTASKRKQSESKHKQTQANGKQGETASEKEREKEKEGEIEIEKEKENDSSFSPPVSPSPGDTGFSPALQSAFDSWLRYKREKRQPYKPEGLKALITEVRNNAAKYGDTAVVELINKCMSANWQGIIWDRLQSGKQASPFQQTEKENAADVQSSVAWMREYLAGG